MGFLIMSGDGHIQEERPDLAGWVYPLHVWALLPLGNWNLNTHTHGLRRPGLVPFPLSEGGDLDARENTNAYKLVPCLCAKKNAFYSTSLNFVAGGDALLPGFIFYSYHSTYHFTYHFTWYGSDHSWFYFIRWCGSD